MGVAAGRFLMGWTDGHPGERPEHEVWLDAFSIARTPVTNAEYAAYLDARRAAPPPFWNRPDFSRPLQPVVGLSWGEAAAFAAWAGARLPTEAEWDGGTRRVSRGGAWRHADPWSPLAHRSSLPPHLRYSDYGLRLARD